MPSPGGASAAGNQLPEGLAVRTRIRSVDARPASRASTTTRAAGPVDVAGAVAAARGHQFRGARRCVDPVLQVTHLALEEFDSEVQFLKLDATSLTGLARVDAVTFATGRTRGGGSGSIGGEQPCVAIADMRRHMCAYTYIRARRSVALVGLLRSFGCTGRLLWLMAFA